jgi:hypothetical protein
MARAELNKNGGNPLSKSQYILTIIEHVCTSGE